MKYLEDTRLTQLTSDLTEAYLNTRGSGDPSLGTIRSIRRRNSTKNKGAKNNKHSSSHAAKTKDKRSSSPYLPSSTFHYAPAGYTSYDGGTSSSSRVIYGKIEAYTTKRAGSDKKTAHEVGERYALEMEKLNEAVEAMKARHAKELEGKNKDDAIDADKKKEKQQRRSRSRSLDGVTFSPFTTTGLPQIDENKTSEHSAKRPPLEGILKPPNKRGRATSFDVSTGPSSPLVSERRGRIVSSGNHDEIDTSVHPLMPQPSLYQSSFAQIRPSSLPTVAPRRLVTDLILTLNASFPDYDFGDARPGDFCTLSVSEAMRRINENMSEFVSTTDKGRDFMPRFWAALDDIVFGLKDAEVYSYSPQSGGGDDDPLGFLTQTLAGGIPGMDSAPSNGGCFLFPSEDTLMDSLAVDNSTALELPHRILTSPVTNSDDTAQVTLWSMNYFFVSRNKKRIVLFTCVQTMRSPQGGEEFEEEGDEYQYGENDLVFDEARRSKTQDEKESEYSVSRGDESVMVDDVDNCGVDVEVDEDEDIGDEDQEEHDFDTGALNTSVHPMST